MKKALAPNQLGCTKFALQISLFIFLLSASGITSYRYQYAGAEEGNTKANKAAKQKSNVEEMLTVQGIVLDADGKPVAGAKAVVDYYNGQATAISNAAGRFELSAPKLQFRGKLISVSANEGKLQDGVRLPWDRKEFPKEPLKFHLSPAKKVELIVVDANGQPVANAITGIVQNYDLIQSGTTDVTGRITLRYPQAATVNFIYALKNGLGVDYRAYVLSREQHGDKNAKPPKVPKEPITLKLEGTSPLRVRVVDGEKKRPVSNVSVYPWYLMKPGQPADMNSAGFSTHSKKTTDLDGQVVFDWIPNWQKSKITFWVFNDQYTRTRGVYDPQKGDGTLTIQVHRLVPISGKVTRQDGSPANGVTVTAVGEGCRSDRFSKTVKTNPDGSYEILAAPNMLYLLIAQGEKLAAEPQTNFAVMPGQPIKNLDFKLRPATRIWGQVTQGDKKKPVEGFRIFLYQYGGDEHNISKVTLPTPEGKNYWRQPNTYHYTATDKEGRYEIFIGSGKFDIRGPSQCKIEKFEIEDEKEREFNFHTALPEKGELKGLVINAKTKKPIASAKVYGIARHRFFGTLHATTDEDGKFLVERELHRTMISATSKDRKLSGVVEIEAGDETVVIPIQPFVKAKGIIYDAQNSKTLANKKVVYGVDVREGDRGPSVRSFGGSAKTDNEGKFELKSLVVGQKYSILVTIKFDKDGRGTSWRRVGTVIPKNGDEIDLGQLTLSAPYKPPTLQEKITKVFKESEDRIALLKKFVSAKKRAKLTNQHLLFIFGNPKSETMQQFMKLRFENSEIRNQVYAYQVLTLNTNEDFLANAKSLAKAIRLSAQKVETDFFLAIADAQGVVLASGDQAIFTTDKNWDEKKLSQFLTSHAPDALDAKELLEAAFTQAKQQNKRVIIQETATWCGPCWMLSRFLDKNSHLWEKDYILVKMDHRWKHAREIMKEYRGEAQGGIPWWAVLDSNGKTLITSNTPEGINIGFPSDKAARKHFRSMFEKTAHHMTTEQLDQLVDQLPVEK